MFAAILLSLSVWATPPPPPLPRDELLADLDAIVKVMEVYHPNPYYSRSPAEIAEERTALTETLPEQVPHLDAFRVAHAFVLSFNDAHTRLYPTDAIAAQRDAAPRLPLSIGVEDGVLEILASEQPALIGAQITALNGVASPVLVDRLARHVNRETRTLDEAVLSRSFPYYLWLATGWEGPFVVTLSDGRVHTLDGVPAPPREAPAPSPAVRHQILDGNVAYLQIRDFYTGNRRTYRRAYAEAFRAFRDAGAQSTLIVDMRDHDGGDHRYGTDLIRYLTDAPVANFAYSEWRVTPRFQEVFRNVYVPRGLHWSIPLVKWFHPDLRAIYTAADHTNGRVEYPPIKPHNARKRFPGEVLVLSNEDTYSAGTCFLALIKDGGLGTIIGRPSGNVANFHADALLRFELPGVGARMQISNSFIVRPSGDLRHAPVQPDVLLPRGADALAEALHRANTTQP
ncbi:MAG: S41 family peptidase [Myxococcota bacterium]